MAKPLSSLLHSVKYKHPDHTKADLQNAIKMFKTLTPTLERYVFPNGVTKELICLDGTIPINFRDATYNIPIGIFISDTHPFNAPLCYVRPTKDMTIKPSRYVDMSGRVYLPYLSDWTHSTCNILNLIQVMQLIFGEECPVYQKTKSSTSSTASGVVYPPALPNSFLPPSIGSSSSSGPASQPVYPFSSQPQPYSSQTQTNNTGTITDEHIKLSLMSAVEDRLKFRMREKMNQVQDEIRVLERTSDDLNRGQKQLDDMKSRMAQEIDELTIAREKLRELDEQLQDFIVKYNNEGEEINPDEVYGPTQPVFKQLLDAFAEENAVTDAIYYTGEGLRKGVITLDVFLKSIRELSRRQFMLRALMRACRAKANLPN